MGITITRRREMQDYDAVSKELQTKMMSVDKSMTKLANSVDIMNSAARGLAEHHSEQQSQDDENIVVVPGNRDEYRSSQMLNFLEMTLLRDKDDAVSSARDFLHFILDAVKTVVKTPSEPFHELMLDDLQKNLKYQERYFNEVEQLKMENASLTEHNSVLIDKERIIKREVDTISEKNKTLEDHGKLLQTQIENANQNITDLEEQLNIHMNSDKQRIESTCKGKERNHTLEEKNIDLNQENSRLHETVQSTSEQIRMLKEKNNILQEENDRLNQKLQEVKRKKMIEVQLYYQRRGDLICKIEEELVYLLKRKVESEGKVSIDFIKCVNENEVHPNKPLLLLCISASRIVTDAANTVQGLKLTSKMSLLIFHHKDEHALPSQASWQMLTGEQYKMLGGVFDLAFLSGKGIYPCSMNEGSINKVVNFINTEGVVM